MPSEVERALAEAPEGTAPLLMDDGMTLVPVSIGSEDPVMFILDTGASMTLLSPATRTRLGLSARDGDTARLTGASGQGFFQRVNLDSLTVGGHTVRNLEAAVVDLALFQRSGVRYAGVLGQNFLKHFDFVYDLRSKELRLYPHPDDAPPTIAGLDTLKRVPFRHDEFGNRFITLDLSVGGKPAKGIFDTGSRHSILNWLAAVQDGSDGEPGTGTEETHGIGHGEPTITQVYTFAEIRTGDVSFIPREVSIADLPVFQTLGLHEDPAVIIGNDMVEGRLIVVAYSTRDLYFSAPLSVPR